MAELVERLSVLAPPAQRTEARRAITTLLSELDAFYLEHRRCGGVDAGVEGDRVWTACSCNRPHDAVLQ